MQHGSLTIKSRLKGPDVGSSGGQKSAPTVRCLVRRVPGF
jgi:hypothetical protein